MERKPTKMAQRKISPICVTTASDLGAEIEAIQDEIKSHMAAARTDTLTAGTYKVVWKEITATRIDTAALRHDLPEIWQEYGKTTTTRRFTISAR